MNKERAVEIIKDLKQEAKVDEPELKYTDEEYSQALDIAIESLETRYQMNDKGEITPIDNEKHKICCQEGCIKCKHYNGHYCKLQVESKLGELNRVRNTK